MANEPKPPRPKAAALGKPPPRSERQKREARPEKIVAFRLGLSAESRAAAFLVAKGFRILARRWRSPAGEIDIVARRKHLLIFVEVKARADFDTAAESITPRQQQRIAMAAESWIAAFGQNNLRDFRFDVILVVPGKMPRHIQGAFGM